MLFFFGFFFFYLCLFCVCLCLVLSVPCENHCFPCNSSVFWLIEKGIYVSHFSFWFLLSVFVCLLFVSRCSFVFVFFLLVLLVCFESQY